jgi:hypothetical protein
MMPALQEQRRDAAAVSRRARRCFTSPLMVLSTCWWGVSIPLVDDVAV